MIYEKGIYEISNIDYHAANGLSRSGVMLYKKSPLHYWAKYKKAKDVTQIETPAILLGNAVHSYILEPEKFNKSYFVADKPRQGSTAGKHAWAQIQAQAAGRIILTTEIYETVLKMYDAFHTNEIAAQINKGGQVEKSIFWKDPDSEVICKARPDLWHSNMIIDLKTACDASEREFRHSMYKYGYHIQSAMIQDAIYHNTGIKIHDFIFVVIEKVDPYAVGIYILDEPLIEKARKEYQLILQDYKKSETNNHWPSYKAALITLNQYYN